MYIFTYINQFILEKDEDERGIYWSTNDERGMPAQAAYNVNKGENDKIM